MAHMGSERAPTVAEGFDSVDVVAFSASAGERRCDALRFYYG